MGVFGFIGKTVGGQLLTSLTKLGIFSTAATGLAAGADELITDGAGREMVGNAIADRINPDTPEGERSPVDKLTANFADTLRSDDTPDSDDPKNGTDWMSLLGNYGLPGLIALAALGAIGIDLKFAIPFAIATMGALGTQGGAMNMINRMMGNDPKQELALNNE